VRFVLEGGFGFIEPDDRSEGYDEYGEYDNDDVFVHIDVLRRAAGSRSNGYPSPGMRLAYQAEQGRRGLRASIVASADDGSFIELPLSEGEVRGEWSLYDRYGNNYLQSGWLL